VFEPSVNSRNNIKSHNQKIIENLNLSGLIKFISNKQQSSLIGYFLASMLFVSSIIQSICMEHSVNLVYVIGIRIRTVMMNLIYKKVILSFLNFCSQRLAELELNFFL
jgi:hypothetical protein